MKTTAKIKTCHKFTKQGGFKKVSHAVRKSSCLGYGPKNQCILPTGTAI